MWTQPSQTDVKILAVRFLFFNSILLFLCYVLIDNNKGTRTSNSTAFIKIILPLLIPFIIFISKSLLNITFVLFIRISTFVFCKTVKFCLRFSQRKSKVDHFPPGGHVMVLREPLLTAASNGHRKIRSLNNYSIQNNWSWFKAICLEPNDAHKCTSI